MLSLLQPPWIINNGGEAYAQIGIGKSTGTKLISACGKIKKTGGYEIELGLPVKKILFWGGYCGGVANECVF